MKIIATWNVQTALKCSKMVKLNEEQENQISHTFIQARWPESEDFWNGDSRRFTQVA